MRGSTSSEPAGLQSGSWTTSLRRWTPGSELQQGHFHISHILFLCHPILFVQTEVGKWKDFFSWKKKHLRILKIGFNIFFITVLFGDKIYCILPFRMICCLSETHSVQHFNQLRYARITTPKNEEKVIRVDVIYRDFNFKPLEAHSDAWTWAEHFKKIMYKKKNLLQSWDLFILDKCATWLDCVI